jgi:hypothetical protein
MLWLRKVSEGSSLSEGPHVVLAVQSGTVPYQVPGTRYQVSLSLSYITHSICRKKEIIVSVVTGSFNFKVYRNHGTIPHTVLLFIANYLLQKYRIVPVCFWAMHAWSWPDYFCTLRHYRYCSLQSTVYSTRYCFTLRDRTDEQFALCTYRRHNRRFSDLQYGTVTALYSNCSF